MIYTAEIRLEAMVLRQVSEIKQSHPSWQNPEQLAKELGLKNIPAPLGFQQEGAAFADTIVVDPIFGTAERRRFTWYHEITHQLLRRNDELYALLDEQYRREEDFTRVREWLADIGSAEFLLPRENVYSLVAEQGYSIRHITTLCESVGASRTAACVQLVRCAPHRCAGVVCRQQEIAIPDSPVLLSADPVHPVLCVTVGITSPTMPYPVARGSIIPTGHLLYDLLAMERGRVVSGQATLPFKVSRREWRVSCEAIRLGEQIFAWFHIDPPPTPTVNQLPLF